MKILIATDHAGFELKEKIIVFLKTLGYEVKDFGAYSYNPKDDYPDFMIPLAEEVSKDSEAKGIILGGSGQGEAIVANRFKKVRLTCNKNKIKYYSKFGFVVEESYVKYCTMVHEF